MCVTFHISLPEQRFLGLVLWTSWHSKHSHPISLHRCLEVYLCIRSWEKLSKFLLPQHYTDRPCPLGACNLEGEQSTGQWINSHNWWWSWKRRVQRKNKTGAPLVTVDPRKASLSHELWGTNNSSLEKEWGKNTRGANSSLGQCLRTGRVEPDWGSEEDQHNRIQMRARDPTAEWGGPPGANTRGCYCCGLGGEDSGLWST